MNEAALEQDRQVRVHANPELTAPLRAAILFHVRARFGWPTLEISQDEALHVEATGSTVRLTYIFDRDFASQYDRTESWSGTITLGGGDEHGTCAWDDAART